MPHACQSPQSPEDGARSSGTKFTGGYELLMWMLGTESQSSARAARALNLTTALVTTGLALGILYVPKHFTLRPSQLNQCTYFHL